MMLSMIIGVLAAVEFTAGAVQEQAAAAHVAGLAGLTAATDLATAVYYRGRGYYGLVSRSRSSSSLATLTKELRER